MVPAQHWCYSFFSRLSRHPMSNTQKKNGNVRTWINHILRYFSRKHNKTIIICKFHQNFILKLFYIFLPFKEKQKNKYVPLSSFAQSFISVSINSSLWKAHLFKMSLYSMECNQRRPVQGATVVLHQCNNTAIHKPGHRCGLLKYNTPTVSVQLSSLPDYSRRYFLHII